MLVRVSLAAAALPWTFRGTEDAEAWLATLPWQTHGAVRAIRVSGSRGTDVVVGAVRALVRSLDDGATDVTVRDETVDDASCEDALGVACRAFDIEAVPRVEQRAWLARNLAILTRVLVVRATICSPEAVSKLIAGLDTLQTQICKASAAARLVAIVLHCSNVLTESIELDLGGPVAPLSATGEGVHRMWATYVHARLAWESAGSIDRALSWDEAIRTRVRLEGEAELEAVLNELAAKEWDAVAPVLRGMVVEVVSGDRGQPVRREELVRNRLLWRPASSAFERPVPWVARALLLANVQPRGYELLRASLVCSPLLRAAMGRCLELEAYARTRFRPALQGATPADADARTRLSEFNAGRGVDVQLYPSACPARPRDAWAFEEFGGFVRALRSISGSQRSALNELRTLRNALSHGHFVSWNVFKRLRAVESDLSA